MTRKMHILPFALYFLFVFVLGFSLKLVYCATCCGAVSHYKVDNIPVAHSAEQKKLEKPKALIHYTLKNPASVKPVVRWTKVEGAPVYEVRVLDKKIPLQPNVFVYAAGYNISLPETFKEKSFIWQVRGLDLDRQPITEWSEPETVYVDRKILPIQYPEPTNKFNSGNGTNLLYPVYNWVPVNGAKKYEVEILSQKIEDQKVPAPKEYKLGQGTGTGFDWYDDDKRTSSQPMYWRVRGLDAKGNPVGIFSPSQEFTMNPKDSYEVGTFGDSITHGGGAVSYSPGDWEYDYQYYLNFPTTNVGRSGDTSRAMLERFDSDVLPFHFKYLIILGGTNSLRGDATAASVIEDLEGIKRKCLQNGITPIFLTLPYINPSNIKRVFDQDTDPLWEMKFAAVNRYIRTQRHIDLGDKMPERGPLPTYLAIDGLHPDIPGKKLMAEAINEQWDRVIR